MLPFKSNDTAATELISHLTSENDIELRQLIRDRTGIVVQNHQMDNLYKNVYTVMQRYGHLQFESFITSLRNRNEQSQELDALVAGITVGESYFFRDTGQIDYLKNQYLPELIASRSKTDKYLRIWSAGCSDGQELYTLAFLLCDLIPDIEDWRIHLLGTDINTRTLASCLHGHYREWSFRNTPNDIKQRYFHPHEDGYRLNQTVQRMARFSYLNLAEDSFPSLLTDTTNIDLILCRNVFIYFDQTTIDSVIRKFKQCLVPEGVLMLGASDLVSNSIDEMELMQTDKAFFYRRQHCKQPFDIKVLEQEKKPAVDKTSLLKTSDIQIPDKTLKTPVDNLQALKEMMAKEDWLRVNQAVDRCLFEMGQTAELLVYKATAAANLGELESALQICDSALELDPVDKHAFYLSAIVLMELERLSFAEVALRKVLFLDSSFLEAHYQLGLLHLRCDRHVQGMKSLKNALRIAEQGNPQHSLYGAPDTSFERMAEVLRNEIKLHQSMSDEIKLEQR